MAFDFPTGVPDGHRVVNTETFSEYAWQAASGKWVMLNPRAASDLFVSVAGDTMTGPLYLTDDPILNIPGVITANTQAVHKNYVDTTTRSIVTGLRTAVTDANTFAELKLSLIEALNDLAGDEESSSY